MSCDLITWQDTMSCDLITWQDTTSCDLITWQDTTSCDLITWQDTMSCDMYIHVHVIAHQTYNKIEDHKAKKTSHYDFLQ